jgi:hypothetical protein
VTTRLHGVITEKTTILSPSIEAGRRQRVEEGQWRPPRAEVGEVVLHFQYSVRQYHSARRKLRRRQSKCKYTCLVYSDCKNLVVMPRIVLEVHTFVSEERSASIFRVGGGSSTFLRDVGIHLQE